MTNLSELMLKENGGNYPASYYAHRVSMLELANSHNGDRASELRGDINGLTHTVIALRKERDKLKDWLAIYKLLRDSHKTHRRSLMKQIDKLMEV